MQSPQGVFHVRMQLKLTKIAKTQLAKMHQNEHSKPKLTKIAKTQSAKMD